MYNYRVYNNLFWIFLIQMKYRLKSMYNHLFLMQLQAVYRKFKEKRKKNPYSRLWILHPKQSYWYVLQWSALFWSNKQVLAESVSFCVGNPYTYSAQAMEKKDD